jgi:hypothetical protein
MVELYIHFPTRLHGIVLNYLSTGTTLDLHEYVCKQDVKYERNKHFRKLLSEYGLHGVTSQTTATVVEAAERTSNPKHLDRQFTAFVLRPNVLLSTLFSNTYTMSVIKHLKQCGNYMHHLL